MTPTAAALARFLGARRPVALLVLGSGLGDLADALDRPARLPFGELPGVPEPTVAGHAGELVLGSLAGRDVLVQRGRFHLYEGHEPATAALLVRAAGRCGVGTVVLTNAAGGIAARLAPGALMLIADHLNLAFRTPLAGPVPEGETRFPDMSVPWDPALRALAHDVARRERIPLHEGVYAAVLGPSYETPAEIRMLERLGADAVGMSTVVECLAARAAGLRCLGVSTITNLAAGRGGSPLAHDDVLVVARAARTALGALLAGVVAGLPGAVA